MKENIIDKKLEEILERLAVTTEELCKDREDIYLRIKNIENWLEAESKGHFYTEPYKDHWGRRYKPPPELVKSIKDTK